MPRVHNELPVENAALPSDTLIDRTARGKRIRHSFDESKPAGQTTSEPTTDAVSLSDRAKELYHRDKVTAANREAAASALKDIALFSIESAHSKNEPNAASSANGALIQSLISF